MANHGLGADAGAGAKRTYRGGSGKGCSTGGDGHAQASVPKLGEYIAIPLIALMVSNAKEWK
eukprot:3286707-Pleurochrysis_carterae.AAC.1